MNTLKLLTICFFAFQTVSCNYQGAKENNFSQPELSVKKNHLINSQDTTSIADTSKMAKYVNKEFKMSFYYPKSWSIMSPAEATNKTNGILNTKDVIVFVINDRDFDKNVNIKSFEIPVNTVTVEELKGLEKMMDESYPNQFNGFVKVSSRIFNICGVNALEYISDSKRLNIVLRQKSLLIIINKRDYVITFTSPKEGFEKANKECFKLIESTLEINR